MLQISQSPKVLYFMFQLGMLKNKHWNIFIPMHRQLNINNVKIIVVDSVVYHMHCLQQINPMEINKQHHSYNNP